MSYPIRQEFISGLPHYAYRNGVGAYEGVVAHATATYNDTAEGERSYESGHWNDAFVHFFVDEANIVQVADTNYIAWGAGSVANQRFVHVELCQTHDSAKFEQAYARYTWLLAKLLADRKLGVVLDKSFWGHGDVSSVLGGTNHTDPYAYLAEHGVSRDKLISDVTNQYNAIFNPISTKRYVKIVNVDSTAIMMDAPNRLEANNIAYIPLNTVVDLITPLEGYNNPGVGYYKIVYQGKTGYINAKYGLKV